MADADSPLFRFQLWRAGLPPALRLLHSINLATYLAFVVLMMLAMFGLSAAAALVDWLILSPAPQTILARPWTPFTYGFVNAFGGFFGLISFAFGFYWLSWIGRDVEETYGSHTLFGVYVLGALGGAALAILVGLILPASGLRPYFGLWTPTTAVLCALAALQPNRKVGLFLLGVIPMTWVAVGFVALSVVFSGDLTVLGAAVVGVLVARARRADRDLTGWARPLFERRRAEAPRRTPPSGRSASASRPASPEEPPRRRARAGLRDVDAILDKILEEGYDSLTPEERDILNRASRG